MTPAGAMRHRIILQRLNQTRDTYGGTVDSWDDVDTIWAAMAPRSGLEMWGADQQQSVSTVAITIRYRADVNETYRVKHGYNLYAIIAPPVNEDMQSRFLIMACELRSYEN